MALAYSLLICDSVPEAIGGNDQELISSAEFNDRYLRVSNHPIGFQILIAD